MIMSNSEHEANVKRKQAAMKKKQAEQRRMTIVLITFVVIIFSLGTIFGCFLASFFTPDTVNAAETTPPSTTEAQEPTELLRNLEIKCGERILDTELQSAMIDACEKYEVPFALALAVAEQESKFNPDAISMTNDIGIMQINKINFKGLRDKGIEPMDYEGNIEAGVYLLSEAIKKHGDYSLALMAYNCGDSGAEKLWNDGVYSTKYSRDTMEYYFKWEKFISEV